MHFGQTAHPFCTNWATPAKCREQILQWLDQAYDLWMQPSLLALRGMAPLRQVPTQLHHMHYQDYLMLASKRRQFASNPNTQELPPVPNSQSILNLCTIHLGLVVENLGLELALELALALGRPLTHPRTYTNSATRRKATTFAKYPQAAWRTPGKTWCLEPLDADWRPSRTFHIPHTGSLKSVLQSGLESVVALSLW